MRVGADGVAEGGGIRLSTDSDSDWGELQFHAPRQAGYTTIITTGRARLSWLLRGGFLKQKLELRIHDGALVEGDEISLVMGDRSGGGPGVRAQTFVEQRRSFTLELDVRGDGRFVPLASSPWLQIAGAEVAQLSLLAPSQVVVGEPFAITLRAQDRFGNPASGCDEELELEVEPAAQHDSAQLTMEARHQLSAGDQGVLRIAGLVPTSPGICRLRARANGGPDALSNPFEILATAPSTRLCWGDLHGQVRSSEKLPDYFAFARDVAALDFAAHQRNDHEIDSHHWAETQRVVKQVNTPGRFVAFLGYEWSGSQQRGGDHNVYFLDDDQPIRRSGHDRVEDKSDLDSDLPHIEDVHRVLRGARAFIVPHVGGRPARLDLHDAALEPVIEVHSTHGSFEWYLREAIERGLRVGFIAGSDDYKLRLGDARPGIDDRRFTRGGLAAVYAAALSREGIAEALRARRCYATTGARIALEVSANGHPMGAAIEASGAVEVAVSVAGTHAIDRVELYRGLDMIHEVPSPARSADGPLQITWTGSSRRAPYSGVRWDGELRALEGELGAVTPLPLDRADELLERDGAAGLRFCTWTSGDLDGFEVKVGEEVPLRFSVSSLPTECVLSRVSAPMSQIDRAVVELCARELSGAPRVIELGPFDRRVTLRRLPAAPAPRELSFSFSDETRVAGVVPYWVRVVQRDGEMAWSSPVYVTRSR